MLAQRLGSLLVEDGKPGSRETLWATRRGAAGAAAVSDMIAGKAMRATARARTSTRNGLVQCEGRGESLHLQQAVGLLADQHASVRGRSRLHVMPGRVHFDQHLPCTQYTAVSQLTSISTCECSGAVSLASR